jgi:hypothetical protein
MRKLRRADYPTSPILQGAKVIQLSSYRRRMGLTSHYGTPHGRAQTAPPRSEFNDDYVERMKVNAAVFIFVVLLITVGIWLIDGLTQVPHYLAWNESETVTPIRHLS